MIEAMIALAISGVVSATALNIYKTTMDDHAKAAHEWSAFTIAQSRMELLANAPRNSSLLNDTAADSASPGTTADQTCSGGVDGKLSTDMRVDALGRASAGGAFELCWKVTNGSPQGSLRNIRVVATYPANGTRKSVFLQTFR